MINVLKQKGFQLSFSLLIGVYLTLMPLGITPGYGDTNDTIHLMAPKALIIVLDTQSYLPSTTLVEQYGGFITHQFPPYAFIVQLNGSFSINKTANMREEEGVSQEKECKSEWVE